MVDMPVASEGRERELRAALHLEEGKSHGRSHVERLFWDPRP